MGVTTMKMISKTNMISTIGVTLISDCRPPPPPAAIPITNSFSTATNRRAKSHWWDTCCPTNFRLDPGLGFQLLRAVLNKVVNQFRRRVVHLNNEAIDLAGEVVEQPYGGHS